MFKWSQIFAATIFRPFKYHLCTIFRAYPSGKPETIILLFFKYSLYMAPRGTRAFFNYSLYMAPTDRYLLLVWIFLRSRKPDHRTRNRCRMQFCRESGCRRRCWARLLSLRRTQKAERGGQQRSRAGSQPSCATPCPPETPPRVGTDVTSSLAGRSRGPSGAAKLVLYTHASSEEGNSSRPKCP